jgi:hypothetical protein
MWHHKDHWFYDLKLVVPKKIYFRTLDTLMIVWLYLWIFALIKIIKRNKTYLNYCCVVDRQMGFLHKILSVCSQGIKCIILRIPCVLSKKIQTMRTSPILWLYVGIECYKWLLVVLWVKVHPSSLKTMVKKCTVTKPLSFQFLNVQSWAVLP